MRKCEAPRKRKKATKQVESRPSIEEIDGYPSLDKPAGTLDDFKGKWTPGLETQAESRMHRKPAAVLTEDMLVAVSYDIDVHNRIFCDEQNVRLNGSRHRYTKVGV